MRKPSHPSEILLSGFIEPHHLSLDVLANHLQISEQDLTQFIQTQTPMTAQLALALEEAGISTAKLWLSLQNNYDLWKLKQNRQIRIEPLELFASSPAIA